MFEGVSTLTGRLAALLLGLDLKEATVLRRLKYSKNQINQILFLLKNIDIKIVPDEIEIGKQIKDNELKDLIRLVNFQIAIRKAEKKELNALEQALMIMEKMDPNKCYRLKDLAVSGRDLLAMGYEEGIGIRLLLERLLDLVIKVLKNEKRSIEYLRKNHPQQRKPLCEVNRFIIKI